MTNLHGCPARRRRYATTQLVYSTLLTISVTIAAGCDRPATSATPERSSTRTHGPAPATESDPLLDKVMGIYEHMNTYRDLAVLRWPESDGSGHEQITVRSQYRRPGQLHLEFADDELRVAVDVSDQSVSARAFDRARLLEKQVVSKRRSQPAKWDDIYICTECLDPRRPKELVSLLMALPVDLALTPAGLLLQAPFWQNRAAWRATLRRVADAPLEGVRCHRWQFAPEFGGGLLWVDATSLQIRRWEFALANRSLHDARLSVDFQDIGVDDPGADTPKTDPLPPDVQRLHHFVLPPDQPTTPLFGRHASGLAFLQMDRRPFTEADWKREIRATVLVWFRDHPLCQEYFQALPPDLNDGLQDRSIQCFAVCTDPPSQLADARLVEMQREWPIPFPILRDPQACGRDVLGIAKAPTTVVLGPKTTVAYFAEGTDPETWQQTADTARRLVRGELVGQQRREKYEQQAQEFMRQLQTASVERPSDDAEVNKSELKSETH